MHKSLTFIKTQILQVISSLCRRLYSILTEHDSDSVPGAELKATLSPPFATAFLKNPFSSFLASSLTTTSMAMQTHWWMC